MHLTTIQSDATRKVVEFLWGLGVIGQKVGCMNGEDDLKWARDCVHARNPEDGVIFP